ncbi:hypothetical protein GJ496_004024, partial [Pomphorhynchus laevis]
LMTNDDFQYLEELYTQKDNESSMYMSLLNSVDFIRALRKTRHADKRKQRCIH